LICTQKMCEQYQKRAYIFDDLTQIYDVMKSVFLYHEFQADTRNLPMKSTVLCMSSRDTAL
jgi:hypothetical protein